MPETTTETQQASQPIQDDSIESRIQAQFNEEKWTRISAKDVSISRFKILDTLIEEAKAVGKIDYLRQASLEQLSEYEASIAARYFLGMIALVMNTPDEGIYLKQLLDQFQDNAKWAVVDVLTEKMLSYTDNRTILRARAVALEKLGKNKEAIPVLEKLARSDRKNPDIALKLADAIINDELEKAISFYKQAAEAYAKSLQVEKLRIVWNKLTDLIPEDFAFYKRIERILASHRAKETIADLYQNLAMYYIKKDDVEKIIELSKKILEYNPNFTRFKNELIRAYKEKFKEHSLINEFLDMSGLTKATRNILNSVQNFETNIVFDKGNYVFHRNWGVGKIADITTNQMVIDFRSKPGHKMDLQMALKSLKPLKENHFWVMQYERPAELQKLFEEDLVSFFKILLASFGSRMTLSDIKAEIAEKYIPVSQWSKWWSKVRPEILKDPNIGVSNQKKDVIELHDTPITSADAAIERFQSAQGFEDRAGVLLDILKDKEGNLTADTLDFMTPFFVDALKSFDLPVRLQAVILLDMIAEFNGDSEPLYSAEVLAEVINSLKGLPAKQAAAIGMTLSNADVKKNFAKKIRLHHPEWKRIYLEMLFETPVKIHRQLLAELITHNADVEIAELMARLRREAKNNAEVFLWLTKQLMTSQLPVARDAISEHILGFFRLLRLLPKIELKGTKLKNQARDILFSGAKDGKEDPIFKLIEQYTLPSVRKIASLFKDVGFISDVEKIGFVNMLRELNPTAFESEEEEVAIETEGISLAVQLEKSGVTVASPNAIERLRKELEHIITVEMPKNSEDIGQAQEKGDLRENAEYKAALEQQAILQATVTRLENDLKTIESISPDQVRTDRIDIGTKVRLKDLDTGDIFVYSIMDQWDADVDKGIISYKSPLGRTLLDQKKGTTVKFHVGDKVQKLEVLSIERAIDDHGNLA